MPKIPRLDISTTLPTGVDIPRQAQAPVQSFGGGQILESANRAVQDFVAREKEKADQIAVTELDRMLLERQSKVEQDAFKLRGKNALDATDTAMKQFDSSVSELSKNIPRTNQRQLDAFRQIVSRRRNQTFSSVQNHSAAEFERFDAQNTESFRNNLKESARLNYGDPLRISQIAEDFRNSIIDQSNRLGFGDETKKEALRSEMREFHKIVIDQMAKDGQYVLGQEYLAANQDEIDEIGVDFSKQITESIALSLAENDPENLETFLKSESAKKNLGPKGISEIRKAATEYITKKTELEKAIRLERQFETENEFMSRALGESFGQDGEILPAPTEREIINAVGRREISETYANKLRDVNRSSKSIFAIDNPATYTEIFDEFDSIVTGKGVKAKVKKDVTFEQLAAFRVKVLEAIDAGTLSPDSAKDFLRITSKKFDESIDDMFEKLNDLTPGFFKAETLIFEDENRQTEAKASIQKEIFRRIDSQEREARRRLRPSEIKLIKDEVVEDFLLGNSDKGIYRLGEIIEVPNNVGEMIKVKVVGFNSSGQAIFDDDLEAKVDIPFTGQNKQ